MSGGRAWPLGIGRNPNIRERSSGKICASRLRSFWMLRMAVNVTRVPSARTQSYNGRGCQYYAGVNGAKIVTHLLITTSTISAITRT